MRHASVLVLASASWVLSPPLAAGQAPPAPVAATLADVAWMAGHWVGNEGGDLSEETWLEPAGDSMVGMWRYVKGGQARIFEILTLKAEDGHVVLRIRHFDPKLVGREDKDRPVELPLVSRGPRLAAFEGSEYNGRGTVRLTYRRPTDDTLLGTLEKDGKKEEFSFRRM